MSCRLLYAFFLLFAPLGAHAINLLAPPTVEPATIGEALVRWKIDSPAGGKVRYGLSEDKLDQTASDGVGTEHAVTLRGLQPALRYFFSVGTARNPLTTGSFIPGKLGLAPDEKPTVPRKNGHTLPNPAETRPLPPSIVRPKTSVREAPATRLTWANLSSLRDHFNRHGGDFGAKSPDDYAAQAWRFRERAAAERLPMKLDIDGTVRVFDQKTRAFASFNRDGTTKTYFRPDSPGYWQRQPGRPIQTPPWISQ
jgi:hypothetical protein